MELRTFYSKILLFGEYSIIHDSMGLAVPYPLFQGELKFSTQNRNDQMTIDSELKAFARYMKGICKEHKDFFNFNVDSFEFDVSQGLYFYSTIPQGYGVGSSGALCAAVYDRYCDGDKEECFEKLAELKSKFSIMETHFHGASSGIDPLISYLNRAILIKGLDDIELVTMPKFKKKAEGGIFLLNTSRPRRTEPLVNLFLEKCKKKSFKDLCGNTLLPITNNCINSLMNGDKISLYNYYKELSDFQYENFTQMIPNLFRGIWKYGLDSDAYCLKLCGAGGGGFLLGMTKNFTLAKDKLQGHEIRPLYYL